MKPVLVMNMWEHAFVYDHQRNLESYVNAWWETIDWSVVAKRITSSQYFKDSTKRVQEEVYGHTY